jgi:hypothetical protein
VTDVTPNFKPEIEPCICGCGVAARPVLKAFKDGSRHAQGCDCRQCKGQRSRKTGLEAQRRAAKRLGVPAVNSMRPSNEELFPGTVRVEAKSGAIVRPMYTAFLKAEA